MTDDEIETMECNPRLTGGPFDGLKVPVSRCDSSGIVNVSMPNDRVATYRCNPCSRDLNYQFYEVRDQKPEGDMPDLFPEFTTGD